MATQLRTLLDSSTHAVRYAEYNGDVSAEVLVDVSALSAGPDGQPVKAVVIEEMWYSVGGQNVLLAFDASTDVPAWKFGGTDATGAIMGHIDFRTFGGIADPRASGFTGDIVTTTGTFDAGEPAIIVIKVRKQYA
jgi:hypothetical protein